MSKKNNNEWNEKLAINDILCKRGEFSTKEGLTFLGEFIIDKNKVWFRGSSCNEDTAIFIKEQRDFPENTHICGVVSGVGVTIMAPDIYKTTDSRDGDGILISMSAIVIGMQFYEQITVSQICVELPELDRFMRPLKVSRNPDGTFNSDEIIEARWRNGIISLYDTRIPTTRNGFRGVHYVRFAVKNGMEVLSAASELKTFCSLFVFLADYDICLPPEIEFIGNNKQGSEAIIYLNGITKINNECKGKEFCILSYAVLPNMQHICTNYEHFIYNNENDILIKTYIELFRTPSGSINRFLDLARIIESFSRKNRKGNPEIICRKIGCHKQASKCEQVCCTCKHQDSCCKKCNDICCSFNARCIDMFKEYGNHLLSSCLAAHFAEDRSANIDSQKIEKICDEIKTLRNYYTHLFVAKEKVKRILDERGDNACDYYSNILHLLLLSAIYKNIGISDVNIRRGLAKTNEHFSELIDKKFDSPDI